MSAAILWVLMFMRLFTPWALPQGGVYSGTGAGVWGSPTYYVCGGSANTPCAQTVTGLVAGQSVVVFAQSAAGGSVTLSVTDGGDSYTCPGAAALYDSGLSLANAGCYLPQVSTGAGSTTVTGTFNSSNSWRMYIIVVTDVGGTPTFDGANTGFNNTSVTTGSTPALTVTGSDLLTTEAFSCSSTISSVASPYNTSHIDSACSIGSTMAAAGINQSSGASVNITFGGSTPYIASGISLKN